MLSSYRSVRSPPGMTRRLHMVSDRESFDQLVADALDELPDWVQTRLENVAVVIDDHDRAASPGLLGLFEGIPQPQRGRGYSGVLPDRITLFRKAIERVAGGDADRLRKLVAHTVAH